MAGRIREKLEGKELKLFCILSILLLFAAGMFGSSWEGLGDWSTVRRLWTIVISRDALISDYFELAGYGAAFINSMFVMAIGFVLLCIKRVKFTGLTMAAFFINMGYALWGKNPLNILPILFGTLSYARRHGVQLSSCIYTALFGTCLAPLVTELVFILPFAKPVNLLFAIGAGMFIGYVLPTFSLHTATMHKGYNLFNVGFSAGVVAFVLVCVLKALGLESGSVLIWRAESPLWIVTGLYGYFIMTFLYGLFLNKGDVKSFLKIHRHSGKAAADFVLLEGVGSTLMNMGLMGITCCAYICLIGGDFSGPVVGAILAAFGFAAFGAHVKNYLPVLLGVYLSTLVNQYQPTTPSMQLAAIFVVGLAPIAGKFGVIPGMIAGLLHSAIVTCTTEMYGGLNLYNNGFSAGWVAIVMVPGLEGHKKGTGIIGRCKERIAGLLREKHNQSTRAENNEFVKWEE